MERVEVAYGFCPECLHPVYIIIGDGNSREFHDEECSRIPTPVPCRNMGEIEQIAELLYVFIQPTLN